MHDALRARARAERITLSELVTRMLERELDILSMHAWLEKRANSSVPNVNIDSVALLDTVRDDYDRR
jgi:post-segregation antitoxin (ccd killing protein)